MNHNADILLQLQRYYMISMYEEWAKEQELSSNTTEKSTLSYILTFIEPLLMLVFMLILPPLFGGQVMIWWSTVFARVVSALLALAPARKQRTVKTV